MFVLNRDESNKGGYWMHVPEGDYSTDLRLFSNLLCLSIIIKSASVFVLEAGVFSMSRKDHSIGKLQFGKALSN